MAGLGNLEMSIRSPVAAKIHHEKETNNTREKKISVSVSVYSDSFTGPGTVQNSMKFSSGTFLYISLNPFEICVIPACHRFSWVQFSVLTTEDTACCIFELPFMKLHLILLWLSFLNF